MFRYLLGHLQALWENRSKSYLYFNASWDPKCLQIVLYECKIHNSVQCVPLATEPSISLIILTPIKILQQNLNRSTFVVWEMKRNVSVVHFKFRCNILISGRIIKEMPGSVASGTHCIYWNLCDGLSTKRLKIIRDGRILKPVVYKRLYKNLVLIFSF